jgi:basic membrane protein A
MRILLIWMLCLSSLSAGDALKIGLICSGSVTDGGWNQLAKEAIDEIKRSLGAEISVVPKWKADACGDELRSYAGEGLGVVIADGYVFLAPAAEVAAQANKMKIVVCGADLEKPGIMTIDFDVSQASYQLGIIGAQLSRTGKLGFVGGAPIPSVKACYRGFVAGARSIKPDIIVVEAYTSWDEPVKSKLQTEAFFTQGIDIVYHDVDAASRGVFEAIKERNLQHPQAPVYVFGCVADQNNNAICAKYTLASAVIRLDATFRSVAEAVRANTFAPGLVQENLQRGTCVAVLNPLLLNSLLTKEMQQQVHQAGEALKRGTISIPAP